MKDLKIIPFQEQNLFCFLQTIMIEKLMKIQSLKLMLAQPVQALIQDFAREGGWLVPKIFRDAQRREKFLGLF